MNPDLSYLCSVVWCVVCMLVTIVSPQREFDKYGYLEYQYGSANSNILITVPHGGSFIPDSLPDRQPGCYHTTEHNTTHTDAWCVWDLHCGTPDLRRCAVVKTRSMYAVQLTSLLVAKMSTMLSGETPNVLLNHLHRNKLDPDSPEGEATLGHPTTRAVWTSYHQFIRSFKVDVFNVGMIIRLDTHIHPDNMIQVLYNVPTCDLNNNNFTNRQSSIRALLERSATDPFSYANRAVLYGGASLGAFISQQGGYQVVPSPQYTAPRDTKYTGEVYSLARHGSRDGGLVDALSISIPESLIDTLESRHNVAEDLSLAITRFLIRHGYVKDSKGYAIDIVSEVANRGSIGVRTALVFVVVPFLLMYCGVM